MIENQLAHQINFEAFNQCKQTLHRGGGLFIEDSQELFDISVKPRITFPNA